METILKRGQLVWALIPDRNNYVKPDPRPAMVTHDVAVDGPETEIPVLVGTTDFYGSGHADLIEIHDSFDRHPITKLRKPTAIVCSWEHTLRYREITEVGGFLRNKKAVAIVAKMEELNASREPKKS